MSLNAATGEDSRVSDQGSSCPTLKVLRGRDGRDGRDGIQGPKGDRGDPGGPPGPEGEQGAPGYHGRPGYPGQKGEKGDRGQNGPYGQVGVPGHDGVPGRQGQKGEKGDRGRNGPYGHVGAPGAPGDPGKPGGPPGPPGAIGLPGLPGPSSGGVTYTRWGHSGCRRGASTIYSGKTAGTHYSSKGGSSDYLCLPDNPQYYNGSGILAGSQGFHSKIYGTEYQDQIQGTNDFNIPCAVCYAATQSALLMIPARYECPSNWTQEYHGYLMTETTSHHRTEYKCVDYSRQSLTGSIANTDGALLYHVEAACNGLPCPPYDTTRELSCVVCTK